MKLDQYKTVALDLHSLLRRFNFMCWKEEVLAGHPLGGGCFSHELLAKRMKQKS